MYVDLVEKNNSCPDQNEMMEKGYQLRFGKFYKLFRDKSSVRNQYDASRVCNSDGGNLAMFKNEEDFKAVADIKGQSEKLQLLLLDNQMM